MTRCAEIQELLPWYIEGALSPDEERAVAEHLAGCERCRDELVTTIRLRQEVRSAIAKRPGLPDRLRDRVAQKLFGRKLAELDVGSFLLGFSLGASLIKRRIPVRGDLRVMGRRIHLFDTRKRRNQ